MSAVKNLIQKLQTLDVNTSVEGKNLDIGFKKGIINNRFKKIIRSREQQLINFINRVRSAFFNNHDERSRTIFRKLLEILILKLPIFYNSYQSGKPAVLAPIRVRYNHYASINLIPFGRDAITIIIFNSINNISTNKRNPRPDFWAGKGYNSTGNFGSSH